MTSKEWKRLLNDPIWMKEFTDRERKEIDFACEYMEEIMIGYLGDEYESGEKKATLADMMKDNINVEILREVNNNA